MLCVNTTWVIDWLNTNAPNQQFYSAEDAKAFVAMKLGVPLCEIPVDIKDQLILTGLHKVNWDCVFYLFKRKLPLLSEEDKSHLRSIEEKVFRLKKERAEFFKNKGYKVRQGEFTRQSYWVHESVIDMWEEASYHLDTNKRKYPEDSVLEC